MTLIIFKIHSQNPHFRKYFQKKMLHIEKQSKKLVMNNDAAIIIPYLKVMDFKMIQ